MVSRQGVLGWNGEAAELGEGERMNICVCIMYIFTRTHALRQNVFPPICIGSFERTLFGFHALLRGRRVEVKNFH